jgi:hypothetical protein
LSFTLILNASSFYTLAQPNNFTMNGPSMSLGVEQAQGFEQLLGVDPEILAVEEKALVRKIDGFLLPTIWLMC